MHSSLDLDELLDNILKAATSIVGAERGTVYVCDHERQQLWSRVTAGPERLEIRLPFGKGLAGFVAVSGESLRVDDARESPLFDPEVDRRTGFRTENVVCTPIREREGVVLGVLQLLNKRGGFGDEDMAFLEDMGGHVAQALVNAQSQALLVEQQRLVKELELAKRIQELLLPARLAQHAGLEVAARMVTSRQVGGDYYDAVPVDGRRILYVLGDVSGKGVAAALVMSNLQAALWATASLGLDLPVWAAHLNELLYDRLGGRRYVTAFLLLVDETGRRGRYLNAGHPPGLLLGGAGLRRLDATGPPLGMLPDQQFEEGELALDEPGSLLLYSDGLTEAMDATGRELGIDGVAHALGGTLRLGAEAAVARILGDVDRFDESGSDRDDRTLLLLKTVPHVD